jgi:hypothetical protein
MAFYRMRGWAGAPRVRRPGRRWDIGSRAAWFAWAVLTFLVIAAPGIVVRGEAEEAGADKVPVEVIRFDPGASSKDISGAVIRGERSLYLIGARGGQRLSASITAAEDNAVFQIYPPGAQAERRDYGVEIVGAKALPGAAEGEDAKAWSGILPATGAYLIVVGPTRGNATYTLKVAIR